MRSKKIVSAALGAAMALSMAVPAFAADTVITATYSEPKIEVTVPTTATAVINPYALPTKYYYDPATNKTCKADLENAVAFNSVASPVAAQPMFLVNYGETALKVYATATAVVKSGSDVKIAEALPEGDAPAKTMAIQVAGTAVEGVAANWVGKDEDTGKAVNALKMDETLATVWNGIDWTDSGVKKATALSAKAEEAELGTLAAISKTEGADTATVQDDCVLAVAVLGEATKKPKTAWSAKDIVTLTVAYSFEVDAT